MDACKVRVEAKKGRICILYITAAVSSINKLFNREFLIPDSTRWLTFNYGAVQA